MKAAILATIAMTKTRITRKIAIAIVKIADAMTNHAMSAIAIVIATIAPAKDLTILAASKKGTI
jgi:hypothetical protein